MRTASIFAIAALIGFGAAAFGSSASAQNAGRDAAIHKCIMEAQARFPDAANQDAQRARTDVYITCMRAAGQTP